MSSVVTSLPRGAALVFQPAASVSDCEHRGSLYDGCEPSVPSIMARDRVLRRDHDLPRALLATFRQPR